MRRVMVAVAVLLSLSLAMHADDARTRLQPAAQKSLEAADQLREAGDHAGALRAYIEAVEADPAAADLALIAKYGVGRNTIFASPDPALVEKVSQQRLAAKEPHIAALRQYLKLHPDDRGVFRELAFILEDAEAEELLSGALQNHPDDPVLYAFRGMVRGRAGRIDEALADYEKTAVLDPTPERVYSIAVVASDYAMRRPGVSDDQKRALLTRAIQEIDRALKMRPGYVEPRLYRKDVVAVLKKLPKGK